MNEQSQASGMVTRLSIMMFLQFFAWGAWFATLGAAMDTHGLSEFRGGAYAAAPIAAIFAPLFLGLLADRFFPSDKVMGVLMLIAGGLMLVMPSVANSGNGPLLVNLILAHLCCYMPTLGLGNTIAFTHIPDQSHFPKIRVWGTIGWIAAGLVTGFAGWSTEFSIFWLGGIASILLGIFCFQLPHTPPPLKGEPINIRSLLMLDAVALMKDVNFLIFCVCSTLICVPLAYYYGLTGTYLTHTGFSQAAATMTIGQMSEIIFMLAIPFFFRALGLKIMILVGMLAWVIRYALFAAGAPDQVTWMLLLAVALHGICYDFFFVTGFMYTDQKAPKAIRGQAQALLVFLTQGVGMFFGYKVAFHDSFAGVAMPSTATIGGQTYGAAVDGDGLYGEALTAARGEVKVTFAESFGQMVSRSLPEGLDPELTQTTMNAWHDFWIYPAILAAGVMVIFGLAFWDKAKADNEADAPADAEATDA